MPVILRLRPKSTVRLTAAAVAIHGIVLAHYILSTGKTAEQARFLADIVSRNVDNLEEFDLIALRELGILKERQ